MTICLVLGIYEAYSKRRRSSLSSRDAAEIRDRGVSDWKLDGILLGRVQRLQPARQCDRQQLRRGGPRKELANAVAGAYLPRMATTQCSRRSHGRPSALITLVEIALAYIIYPIAVQIFALIYTFWGTCLFAMGPFVIALAPSSLINSLTKYYALNLGIWNAWSIIYAVFGCLITAIHANDVNAILNGDLGSFGLGPTLGATGPLDGGIETIGLISIMYAICILLIPMVAAFILRGQFSAVGAGPVDGGFENHARRDQGRGTGCRGRAGRRCCRRPRRRRNGTDGRGYALDVLDGRRLWGNERQPGRRRKHAAAQYARRPEYDAIRVAKECISDDQDEAEERDAEVLRDGWCAQGLFQPQYRSRRHHGSSRSDCCRRFSIGPTGAADGNPDRKRWTGGCNFALPECEIALAACDACGQTSRSRAKRVRESGVHHKLSQPAI